MTYPTCIFQYRAAKARIVLLQDYLHSHKRLRSVVLLLLQAYVARGQENVTYSADGRPYVILDSEAMRPFWPALTGFLYVV